MDYSKQLELLGKSFMDVLYDEDEGFNEILESQGMNSDELLKNKHWDWTHGVGLYGYWKLFTHTNNESYYEILENYYNKQIAIGLPKKNINSVCPLLTLAFMYGRNENENYKDIILEWADWIMNDLPRTQEGGFQHITVELTNTEELWDDTLFMTVLFLAKTGKLFNNKDMIDEAIKQFYIHIKYLKDENSGLWYHGWTFIEQSNFVNAFWCRGNSWITVCIPEMIEILELTEDDKVYIDFKATLNDQVQALKKVQSVSGLWPTLLDDPDSYDEASGSAGILAGVIKGNEMKLLEGDLSALIKKGVSAIVDNISDDGILQQVSYGTAMGKDSLDFYRNIPLRPMPYGQALAMLALIEYQMSEVPNV